MWYHSQSRFLPPPEILRYLYNVTYYFSLLYTCGVLAQIWIIIVIYKICWAWFTDSQLIKGDISFGDSWVTWDLMLNQIVTRSKPANKLRWGSEYIVRQVYHVWCGWSWLQRDPLWWPIIWHRSGACETDLQIEDWGFTVSMIVHWLNGML